MAIEELEVYIELEELLLAIEELEVFYSLKKNKRSFIGYRRASGLKFPIDCFEAFYWL